MKKTLNQLFFFFFSFFIFLGLVKEVEADEIYLYSSGTTYDLANANDGDEIYISADVTLTGSKNVYIYLDGGSNLTLNNVVIDLSATNYAIPIALNGEGTITLSGTNELKAGYHAAAIDSYYSDLTIIGTGTLTARGGEGAAGIGGGYRGDVSSINIGGSVTINAYGGENGAGIGSGYNGDFGDIAIYDSATISAYGGLRGAGIGAGDYTSSGTIRIYGESSVIGDGGNYGAGIGGGEGNVSFTVDIYGSSVVNAYGGQYAAGIGGGNGYGASGINIYGLAVVQAQGGHSGAGIGGGRSGHGDAIIFSDDAKVKAYGGSYAADIGGGSGRDGRNITINGRAEVLSYGYDQGIGGGKGGDLVNLQISGDSKVFARSIGYGREASLDTTRGGDMTVSGNAKVYYVKGVFEDITINDNPSICSYALYEPINTIGSFLYLTDTTHQAEISTACSWTSDFPDASSIVSDVSASFLSGFYKVYYDGNQSDGGVVPTDSTIYEGGDTATILSGLPTRTGYSFVEWLSGGSGYSSGDSLSIIDNHINLTADWLINSYTLSFNGNGSDSGLTPDDIYQDYNTTTTVLGNIGSLSREGYIFDSWNTLENGLGVKYVADDTFTFLDDTTLYAIWTEVFTVTANEEFEVILEEEESGSGGEEVTEVDLKQEGQVGVKTVGIKKETKKIAVFNVDFSEELDWSELVADKDETSAVLHYPGGFDQIPGATGEGFILYIPDTGQDQIRICPGASSLGDVGPGCSGEYFLTEMDENVERVIEDGESLWKVSGLTGTGGEEVVPVVTVDLVVDSPIQLSTVHNFNCSMKKPFGSVDLFQIDRLASNKVKLSFSPLINVSGYLVKYWTKVNPEIKYSTFISNNRSDGVIQFDIGELNQSKDWVFVVQAHNGCAYGDWSNQASFNLKNKYWFRYY